ncbi:MAG: hypothetical protein AUJ72_02075 [Candidatus Omnitrophica bacterium CG1_02_46_14]|nr:MAG: hypothetical protein AUJ72_02075 [Candidatus Omnitrophica bacterium CG1_02_46_14]
MKKNSPIRIPLAALTLFLSVLVSTSEAKSLAGGEAQQIPIQHSGRVKSFEAFSRQTLELITTKESWEHKPPVDVIFEALSKKEAAADWAWVRIRNQALVTTLGLPADKQFYSYNELKSSFDKIEALVKTAQTKRDQDVRPSKPEQEAEALFSRLMEVKHLMTGETIMVVPSSENEVWTSPYQNKSLFTAHFQALIKLYGENKFGEFAEKAKEWNDNIHQITGEKYRLTVKLEKIYYDTRPFQQAWMAYLLAFLIFTFFKKKRSKTRSLGIAFLALAIFFHTLGLTLRVLILQRPPVSNMYESMIYMNWVLIVAAVLFSIVKKNASVASIGALISAIVMIYGNLLPIETNLEVLVPVLRSNYWLTIHVMTIVSSYGVFALAMGLGHRHLFLDVRQKLSKDEERRSEQIIYQSIQVGVLLLGIGTVLGGVWANESWGRFWGWDPKETWALITFLGYLILVHLKHAKLIKPYTLAVSAILGFLLVLMTWYGVNFILGRGLHSYGQGAGGMIWVIYYLIFEGLFLGVVFLKK